MLIIYKRLESRFIKKYYTSTYIKGEYIFLIIVYLYIYKATIVYIRFNTKYYVNTTYFIIELLVKELGFRI